MDDTIPDTFAVKEIKSVIDVLKVLVSFEFNDSIILSNLSIMSF